MFIKIHIMLLGLVVLAACGGGGGDTPSSGIDPRLARLDIYEMQKLRVLGDPDAGVPAMALTDVSDLPTTGTVDFEGFATIRVENPGDPMVLYGDADVSVGFGDNSVAGTMDSFFGTDDAGAIADYTGAITIGGASTDGLTMDYSGTLANSAGELTLDGTMGGQFMGTPVSALSASDLEAGVTYMGVPYDATIVLIAESVPPP